MGVRRERRASKGAAETKLRPYFEEARDPSKAWKDAMRELVGFDIDETRERLQRWMHDAGFMLRDEHHRVIGFNPATDEPETKLQRKACAAFQALVRLTRLDRTWAPERVAARRWHRAIERLRKDLDIARAAAAVRAREDSYFLGHCVGETATRDYGRRAEQTRTVAAVIEQLDRAALEAQSKIPRYRNDVLSSAAGIGRASKTYLGGIELDLHEAGFTFPEIATLSADGENPKRAAAAERVKKRVAAARAHRRRRPW